MKTLNVDALTLNGITYYNVPIRVETIARPEKVWEQGGQLRHKPYGKQKINIIINLEENHEKR